MGECSGFRREKEIIAYETDVTMCLMPLSEIVKGECGESNVVNVLRSLLCHGDGEWAKQSM